MTTRELFATVKGHIWQIAKDPEGCQCDYCRWLQKEAQRVLTTHPEWEPAAAIYVTMRRFWDAHDQSGDVIYDHDPVTTVEELDEQFYGQWQKRG